MTAILSILSPLTITPAMVISSTAVSHSVSEPVWVATTLWTKGDIVYRSTFGRRYECLVTGIDAGLPEDTPLRWDDLGATDQMTMFDGEVGTQSIADDILTVVFRPGHFSAIYVAGIEGTQLDITVTEPSGGAELFSHSDDLEGSEPDDYYEWCFDPFRPKTDFIATGIEPYGSAVVTITITNSGGIAKCGIASFGALKELGPSLSGVTIEPKSFARVTTDSRGKTSIKKGKSALDMSISALVALADVTYVVDTLKTVMGIPCVVIGSDSARMQSLRVFGLPNGKVTFPGGESPAVLSLNVSGMI